MVQDEIEDDAEVPGMSLTKEFFIIVERLIFRVNVEVVRNVITEVVIGRRVDRGKLDRADAQQIGRAHV